MGKVRGKKERVSREKCSEMGKGQKGEVARKNEAMNVSFCS
jgi:hypothetical protein